MALAISVAVLLVVAGRGMWTNTERAAQNVDIADVPRQPAGPPRLPEPPIVRPR